MLTKADIKLISSLADKEARSESGLFAVEGDKMVLEVLSSHFEVERVMATSRSGLLTTTGIRAVEIVGEKEMERISRLKTPSASLAVVRIPHYDFSPAIFGNNLVLALDGVQDPGNLGTIIRIADWFGIADIVCSPATADWLNPKVVQATMGALLRVRIHYVPLAETLADAARSGVNIYGTFLEGENIYDAPVSAGGVIIMGNEGRGISPAVEAVITKKLFIPPYPGDRQGSESLNVATATAVVCSEFRRKTGL
jgi:TrmH family RNA methyltransferase